MTRIALIETASQKFDSDLQSEWARRQKMLIEQNQEQEQMMLKILQEHDKKAFDLSEQLQLQYQKQQDVRFFLLFYKFCSSQQMRFLGKTKANKFGNTK